MMVKESKTDAVRRRSIEHGLLFIKREFNTIRELASHTGHSKSTVHLDLTRLEKIHPALYEKVRKKLDLNFSVKHIRGGEALRKKVERNKKNDSK